jgi:hypothetical protein
MTIAGGEFVSLYKYVAPDRWGNIFKDGLIRFTQPSVFNDPFEMQPYFECLEEETAMREVMGDFLGGDSIKKFFDGALRVEYLGIPPEVKDVVTLDVLRRLVEERLKNDEVEIRETLEQTIAQMSNKNGQFTGEMRNDLLFLNKLVGILSLTEKRDNLLMWAHYAHDHQGLVIEFDDTHEYFHREPEFPPLRFFLSPFSTGRYSSEQWDAIEAGGRALAPLAPRVESSQAEDGDDVQIGRLLKVLYSVERPQRKALKDVTATDILLVKSKDWEYEQEWRMLRFLYQPDKTIPNGEGDIHLFSFPASCVKGVIFGCRMSVPLKEEISKFLTGDARYSHVKKYTAVLSERRFGLDIIPSET